MLPTAGRTHPRTVRALRSLAIIAGLTLLLAGCLKLDMAITISPDDTVDGEMVFAVNKQLLELTGQDADDVLGDTTVPSDVEGATQEPYEDEDFVGTQVTFEDVALSDLSEGSDPDSLTIVRTGDTYEVEGVMDLSTEDADLQGNPFEDQITEAFDTAQLRIAITFPGEVLETNGQVDGTTVSWEPVFGERNVLTAVASASGAGASDPNDGTDAGEAGDEDPVGNALLYVVVGLVIIGVMLGVFVTMRRKSSEAPPTDAAGEASPPTPVTSSEPETPPAPISPPTPPPPPASEPTGGGPFR
jgi:hypothetical protein